MSERGWTFGSGDGLGGSIIVGVLAVFVVNVIVLAGVAVTEVAVISVVGTLTAATLKGEEVGLELASAK